MKYSVTTMTAALLITGLSAANDSLGIPSSQRTNPVPIGVSRSADAHTLHDRSMFAVADAKPRIFQKHDLIQVIVQESSRAESSQEVETTKESSVDGSISAWPHLSLADILQLQLKAGNTTALPAVNFDLEKEFSGEGDYKREDDFTARLTAEVIAIRPNGNLVLEARTFIKTDEEESTIKVTGECRPEDVAAANTVFSHRLHDLRVVKTHSGELRKANEKGLVAKFFDAIFAF